MKAQAFGWCWQGATFNSIINSFSKKMKGKRSFNLLKMAEYMKVKGTPLVALSSAQIGIPRGGMHIRTLKSFSLSMAQEGSSGRCSEGF